jgi:hypothetical protein
MLILILNGINGKLIVAVIGSLDSTLDAGNGNDSCDKLCKNVETPSLVRVINYYFAR